MAQVLVKRRVVFTFEDNNEKKSNVTINVAEGAPYADVEAFAAGMFTALDGISTALITGYSIASDYAENAPVAPPAESEVERKLVIPFVTTRPGHGYVMEIPSPTFAVDENGTDVVDETNALVQAVISTMLNGPLGTGNAAVTVAGVDLVDNRAPFISHRNRQKRS